MKTKKAYLYITIIAGLFLAYEAYSYYIKNIYTVAIVKDGKIVATRVGNITTYFNVPIKLTNQNMINYDSVVERWVLDIS